MLAAAAALGLALLLLSMSAAAQRRPERGFAPVAVGAVSPLVAVAIAGRADSTGAGVADVAVISTGAFVGGALGGLVGGFLGYRAVDDGQCDNICGPLGGVLVGLLLEPTGDRAATARRK